MARDKKIGIGWTIPTADPASHLVEVSDAEFIGMVDEDGVGVGNIDPVFDDRGSEQDIGLAAFKRMKDGVYFFCWHLPMPDDNACLGKHRLQFIFYFKNALHAVVDEEGLAITGELA